MTNDGMHLVASECCDEGDEVVDEPRHTALGRIGIHIRLETGRTPIPTKIRGKDVVAGISEGGQLVSPTEPEFRKSVEKEHEPVRAG
ncbi:hypothetical protein GCM10023317_51840 [Actinopolymorpha pittospori]